MADAGGCPIKEFSDAAITRRDPCKSCLIGYKHEQCPSFLRAAGGHVKKGLVVERTESIYVSTDLEDRYVE